MTTLIHNATPMVYAHVLEFPKPKGAVTPDTWYEALLSLQETREARNSMRDVWEWERSKSEGAKLAAKANARHAEKAATRPAPKPAMQERPKGITRKHKPYTDKTCDSCGKTFPCNRDRQRYCSEACQIEAKNAAKRVGEKAYPPMPCAVCGTEFERIRANQKYCAGCVKDALHKLARDGAKRRYTPSAYSHTCVVCGSGFTSNRPDSRACLGACQKEYSKSYRAGKLKPSVAAVEPRCEVCACVIASSAVYTGQKRCADCQLKHRRSLNRAYYHRIQAEKRQKQEATA